MKNSNLFSDEPQHTEFRFNPDDLICDECAKPLALYGQNTIQTTAKFGKDRILTRFLCDLCYLEFQVSEREKAKFYASQKQFKSQKASFKFRRAA